MSRLLLQVAKKFKDILDAGVGKVSTHSSFLW